MLIYSPACSISLRETKSTYLRGAITNGLCPPVPKPRPITTSFCSGIRYSLSYPGPPKQGHHHQHPVDSHFFHFFSRPVLPAGTFTNVVNLQFCLTSPLPYPASASSQFLCFYINATIATCLSSLLMIYGHANCNRPSFPAPEQRTLIFIWAAENFPCCIFPDRSYWARPNVSMAIMFGSPGNQGTCLTIPGIDNHLLDTC